MCRKDNDLRRRSRWNSDELPESTGITAPMITLVRGENLVHKSAIYGYVVMIQEI